MTELSRRNFIRFLAASLGSLGSLYLAGCLNQDKLLSRSISPDKISPTPFVPDPTNTAAPEPTATDQPTDTPVPTPTPADLAVARNGKAEDMVRAAVKALGGMGKFVKPGDSVVVKPNICVAYHTYEYAATTNPWVVGTVVKLAVEAGAKSVKVMDFPFGGTGEQAYYKSGIQEQVQKAGGKMVVMSGVKFVKTDIPGGKDLKSARIFDDVLRADVLINVPIAKHHGLALLTLAMKNLMGVVWDRQIYHAYGLDQSIAEFCLFKKPDLNIVDAYRVIIRNGPRGYNPDDLILSKNLLISEDIVAVDTAACKIFGINPDKVDYLRMGHELKLGKKNLNDLNIKRLIL